MRLNKQEPQQWMWGKETHVLVWIDCTRGEVGGRRNARGSYWRSSEALTLLLISSISRSSSEKLCKHTGTCVKTNKRAGRQRHTRARKQQNQNTHAHTHTHMHTSSSFVSLQACTTARKRMMAQMMSITTKPAVTLT